MTEQKRENPQKVLSKELLEQSLLDLMKEKPYNQISITEITEHAQLSRRTFYRHYVVIGDILDCIMHKLCNQYISLLLEQKEYGFRTLSFVYFTFWESHKDFLFILEKNALLYLLLQKYNQYFSKIYAKVIGNNDIDNSTTLEYAFYFNAGGFWNLHLKLLKDGTKLSPLEMANLAETILKHNI